MTAWQGISLWLCLNGLLSAQKSFFCFKLPAASRELWIATITSRVSLPRRLGLCCCESVCLFLAWWGENYWGTFLWRLVDKWSVLKGIWKTGGSDLSGWTVKPTVGRNHSSWSGHLRQTALVSQSPWTSVLKWPTLELKYKFTAQYEEISL